MKSCILPGSSSRNLAIAAEFGSKAETYNRHARIHEHVAERLTEYFPEHPEPDILEIGCGTGLLTEHLMTAYPKGRFVITDLSEKMLDQCRRRFGACINTRFSVMDGENPDEINQFDLIASSMTLQWFEAPLTGLNRLRSFLKPGGHLVFATIAENSFPEWRQVLNQFNLPSGLIDMPHLPGTITVEHLPVKFETGIEFLQAIRDIGARKPKKDYWPVPPGKLRRALREFEKRFEAQVSWPIVYGHLRA